MIQLPDQTADAPWHRYFAQPQIAAVQIAANRHERGLVASDRRSKYQLYAWDVNTGDLHPLTNAPDGVIFGGISPDGEFVYYLDEERGHYLRVPFADAEDNATDISPDLPAYQSSSISQSLDGTRLGFSATTPAGTTIYHMAVSRDGSLGTREVLYTSQANTYGPWFSYDAGFAVIATTEKTGTADHALLAFPLDGGEAATVRVLHEQEADLVPVGFAPLPGDTRLLATTDAIGVTRPVIWDVGNGDRIDMPFDDIDGDIGAWGWSPDGEKVLLFRVHRAIYQLYIYDLKRSTLTPLEHADGAYFGGFFLTDDEIVTIWTDAAHPAHVITLDAVSGTQKRTLIPPNDALDIAPWRSITFPSGGGAQIQAWLATPDPAQFGEGPYPLVIYAHDGPFDVQLNAFNPNAAAWTAHGFAWVSVNYRGSTTFGIEHQGSIIGIPGHREVDDLVAAREWLVGQGIADAGRVLLHGENYGGMLVLQTLGRRPEGWACAVAVDPIVEWTRHYESVSAAERAYIEVLFGGTPADYASLYRASSPMTYVDAVETTVFIASTRSRVMVISYNYEVGEAGAGGNSVRLLMPATPSKEHMEHVLKWVYWRLHPADDAR